MTPLSICALAGAAALAAFLGACQTEAPKSYLEYSSPQDPVSVSSRISANVGACWFAGKRPEFASFSYAPELISYSGRPRVLIVRKADPTGLPTLVIEASKGQHGTSVKLFGPLLATAEAPVIRTDVQRWVAGGTGC